MNNPHGNMVDLRDPAKPILLVADRGHNRIVRYTLDDKPIDMVEGTVALPFPRRKSDVVVPGLTGPVTPGQGQQNRRQHGRRSPGPRNPPRTTEDRSEFIPGQFVNPHGAIFDHNGNIFVANGLKSGASPSCGRSRNSMLPELAAEFFGTLILILFGNGVVAMVVLFAHGIPGEVVNGGYTNINFAFGIGVTMGMLCGREDLRSPYQSRGYSGGGGVPRIFLGQGDSLYGGADRSARLRGGARVLELPPEVSRGGSGFDHTAGVFTTFPAFRTCLGRPVRSGTSARRSCFF